MKKFMPNIFSINNILLIFSSVSMCYLFNSELLKFIGFASLLIMIFICIIISGAMFKRIKADMTFIVWLHIAFYLLINSIIFEAGMHGMYPIILMLGLMYVYILFSNLSFSYNDYNIYRNVYKYIFYIIILLYIINSKMDLTITHSTVVKCIFPLSFFALNYNKYGLIKIMIFVLLALYFGERTGAVVILATYFLYCAFKSTKNRKFFKYYFIIVLTISLLFPILYVWSRDQLFGDVINMAIKEYTGEQFYSGRDRLWSMIFASMKGHEVFGMGFENNIFASYYIWCSTHNVYLFLYLNGGILLLGLFLIFLITIWRRICYNINSLDGAKKAAYFLGLIIFMDFELFMVSNNFVVSFLWWIVLAIPTNKIEDNLVSISISPHKRKMIRFAIH